MLEGSYTRDSAFEDDDWDWWGYDWDAPKNPENQTNSTFLENDQDNSLENSKTQGESSNHPFGESPLEQKGMNSVADSSQASAVEGQGLDKANDSRDLGPGTISFSEKERLEALGFRFEIADPNLLGGIKKGEDGYYYVVMGQIRQPDGSVRDKEVRVFKAAVPKGSPPLYWVQYPHYVDQPKKNGPIKYKNEDKFVRTEFVNINNGLKEVDLQIENDKRNLQIDGFSHFKVHIFLEHNIIGPKDKANAYAEKLFNDNYVPAEGKKYDGIFFESGFIDDNQFTKPRVRITYLLIAKQTEKVPIYDYPEPG